MAVIVQRNGGTSVVVDRARTAAIVSYRPVTAKVNDQRAVASVQDRASTLQVASPGPQGQPGTPGGTSEQRTASEALGGHRMVRSTGNGMAGYASNDNPAHGDDTIGMTLGAAVAGDPVNVQRFGPVIFAGWTWVPGDAVFLGANGLPTQVAPAPGTTARFCQPIGHAEDATTLFLNVQDATYFD